MTTLATYWSLVINNPSETDMVLVLNSNEKYIRSFVWTPEVGKDGTPHIQAWLRLHRNQPLSFVKKLYPQGHFKPIVKDDYNANTHTYVQKNDDTTVGVHTQTHNDPLPGQDTVLYRVLERWWSNRREDLGLLSIHEVQLNSMLSATETIENEMVSERAGLEKLFISPLYAKMKRRFWRQIIIRLTTVEPEIILPTMHGGDSIQGDKDSGDVQEESVDGSDDQEASDEEASSDSGSDGSDQEGSEGSDGE